MAGTRKTPNCSKNNKLCKKTPTSAGSCRPKCKTPKEPRAPGAPRGLPNCNPAKSRLCGRSCVRLGRCCKGDTDEKCNKKTSMKKSSGSKKKEESRDPWTPEEYKFIKLATKYKQMGMKLVNPKWGTPSQSATPDPKGGFLKNQPSRPKYGTTPTEKLRKKYDGLSLYYFKIFELFKKNRDNPAEFKRLQDIKWLLGIPPKFKPTAKENTQAPTVPEPTPDKIWSSPDDVGSAEDHQKALI